MPVSKPKDNGKKQIENSQIATKINMVTKSGGKIWKTIVS